MKASLFGLHHVALRCAPADFGRTLAFYWDFLGLEPVRQWEKGAMLRCGEILFELLKGEGTPGNHPLEHFALGCQDVDAWAEKVRETGLAVLRGPEDIVLGGQSPCPARIFFFQGPAGEVIELFEEGKKE